MLFCNGAGSQGVKLSVRVGQTFLSVWLNHLGQTGKYACLTWTERQTIREARSISYLTDQLVLVLVEKITNYASVSFRGIV